MSEFTKSDVSFENMWQQVMWKKRVDGDSQSKGHRHPDQVDAYGQVVEEVRAQERHIIGAIVLNIIADFKIPFAVYGASIVPSAGDIEAALERKKLPDAENNPDLDSVSLDSDPFHRIAELIAKDPTLAPVFLHDVMRKSNLEFGQLASKASVEELKALYMDRHPKKYEIYSARKDKNVVLPKQTRVRLAAD